MAKTLQFRVYGKVQGVGFRYSTQKQANILQLQGWVRNRTDGSVEGIVQGEADSVERFLQWLKVGPQYAEVSELDILESQQIAASGFLIAG